MRGQRLRFRLELGLVRAVGAASRASGRGGGTTLPGRLLLRLAPDALPRLAARLDGPVTAVSATNGKTTTASLLAGILSAAGREPVHNSAGSNMSWGVATALVAGGGREGLFEVDEAWLGRVAGEVEPDLFVLCNLFRDQLDRHGELETLAEGWRELLGEHLVAGPGRRRARAARAVLNADDPLVADLGRDERGEPLPGVSFFGVDDRTPALGAEGMAHDAKHCRRCGTPYAYEATLLGHLGHYRCPGCGAGRPEPDVAARSVELRGMEGSRLEVATPAGELRIDLPLPGLYNAYNALAALAAALELGISADVAAAALGRADAVFGRVERLEVEGGELAILLVKNPTGATEVLRTIAASLGDGESADLWIALNDGTADGRDISWIWDTDFEQMAGRVRRVTCAGTRAEELALRLAYAGWPRDLIEVGRPVESSLDAALAAASGRLFALPTYTALLELQALLARRGLTKGYLR